ALEALRRHHIERAVFHWHKAPAAVTAEIVAAGYFVSVTPEVVYRERDREMVEAVDLESLLVESDAPWTYSGEFAALPSGPWLAGGGGGARLRVSAWSVRGGGAAQALRASGARPAPRCAGGGAPPPLGGGGGPRPPASQPGPHRRARKATARREKYSISR